MKNDDKRACIICGEAYIPKIYNQKCCSPECSEINKKEHERKKNESLGFAWEERTCVICGQTFFPEQRKSVTCSLECVATYRNRRKSEQPKNIRRRQRNRRKKLSIQDIIQQAEKEDKYISYGKFVSMNKL